jgi:hypothetical protein
VYGYADVQYKGKMVFEEASSKLGWSMEESHNDSGDGFQVSGACVNIAKDQYRGHKIHKNTPVGFQFSFSGLHDMQIK